MIGIGSDTNITIKLGTSDIEAYLGTVKVYPNTAPVPTPYAEQYFTVEAIDDNTVVHYEYTSPLLYNSSDGINWTSMDDGDNLWVTLNAGQKCYFKCLNPPINTTNGVGKITANARFKVYGNIMSLYYGDNFIGQDDLTGLDYVFRSLFDGATTLVDAQNLILPATTLAIHCYNSMFYRCTSLTTAPVLPATTLTQSCYSYMFDGCTSLTTAPVLPATTLANNCYAYMFLGCTSLTTAPVLPATTLASYCYVQMFRGCTGLTTAPELPATTLTSSCYNNMFQGCTSLVTAPVLPATTLVSNCYRSMFNGCTSLNYIKAMFTTTPSIAYTNGWVNGVSTTGTFVKNSAAEWDVTGVDGVPTGWTIETASE